MIVSGFLHADKYFADIIPYMPKAYIKHDIINKLYFNSVIEDTGKCSVAWGNSIQLNR